MPHSFCSCSARWQHWLVGWLVGSLVGWLAGWVVGWLVGWFCSLTASCKASAFYFWCFPPRPRWKSHEITGRVGFDRIRILLLAKTRRRMFKCSSLVWGFGHFGSEMGWLYKQRNKKSSSKGFPAIVVQREFGDFKREMEMKSVETPGDIDMKRAHGMIWFVFWNSPQIYPLKNHMSIRKSPMHNKTLVALWNKDDLCIRM